MKSKYLIISIVFFLNINLYTTLHAQSNSSFLNGEWTYRSLLNNPVETVQFNDLEFATAIMKLNADASTRTISGELDMGQYGKLTITGNFKMCDDIIEHFELQGDGIKGTSTEGWIYNYYGYLVPNWKQGKEQIDALVGSVVRSVDHGTSKAGKTASFYMVKRYSKN